jgi:hypothetical protein
VAFVSAKEKKMELSMRSPSEVLKEPRKKDTTVTSNLGDLLREEISLF